MDINMAYMWQEIMQQPGILTDCLKKNEEEIQKIVKAVRQKDIRYVVIAARGTSDNAAVYGKYILEIMTGIPVALAAPSVVTIYGKKLRLDHTLVIGISQSGRAGDAAEVIECANQSDAVTVSITNFPDSPLAGLSDFHLSCEAGLEKSVAATKTFTAQMILLAALAAAIADSTELMEELGRVPAGIEKILQMNPEIEKVVQRYRFMNECFVLARGVNYPIALEAALKIQETSYVRAKAFAVSDFYHGPMAMIEKDMPVFIFSPDGPMLKDVRQMVAKLAENKADLLIVSNLKDVCALGQASMLLNAEGSELVFPFYNAVVAQMLAYHLSVLKQYNPDSPRMLQKVTITR